MFDYTLVVTSCNRHELLRRTLDSFIKYADIPPVHTVIVEDGEVDAPDWMECSHQKDNLPKTWITNPSNLGQLANIDRGYSEVKTEYLFHCEDDWEFFETGFVRESYEILADYPAVSRVGLLDTDQIIPVIDDPRFPFRIAQPYFHGFWGGMSWQPGLRRLSDYKKVFGTFSGQVLPETFKGRPFDCNALREAYFSNMMLDRGYVTAELKQCVRHIG
jgi:hypothetical protein